VLIELPVGAVGEVDGAHAAAAEEPVKFVRTDSAGSRLGEDRRFRAGSVEGAGAARGGEVFFIVAGDEQRAHLGEEALVPLALGLEDRLALLVRHAKGGVEDGFSAREEFEGILHGESLAPNSGRRFL
jgi:hypothetical protein